MGTISADNRNGAETRSKRAVFQRNLELSKKALSSPRSINELRATDVEGAPVPVLISVIQPAVEILVGGSSPSSVGLIWVFSEIGSA